MTIEMVAQDDVAAQLIESGLTVAELKKLAIAVGMADRQTWVTNPDTGNSEWMLVAKKTKQQIVDDKLGGWAVIWQSGLEKMLREPEFKGEARGIFLALMARVENDGRAIIQQNEIAEMLKTSQQAVSRGLAVLIKLGIIANDVRGIYKINPEYAGKTNINKMAKDRKAAMQGRT